MNKIWTRYNLQDTITERSLSEWPEGPGALKAQLAHGDVHGEDAEEKYQ
jgi:hypothetical protein